MGKGGLSSLEKGKNKNVPYFQRCGNSQTEEYKS